MLHIVKKATILYIQRCFFVEIQKAVIPNKQWECIGEDKVQK